MSLRGYRRSWLTSDLVAGATLAAVAIPETMGYTSIAQTPVVTVYRARTRVAVLTCKVAGRGGTA